MSLLVVNKKNLFSEHISACERRLNQNPLIESMYQDHKYVVLMIYIGNDYTHSSMVAMALAWAERRIIGLMQSHH